MGPRFAYRPDIDGLRAIAVLAVLFHHLELPFFPGGFVGVDIFFVISGFLITRIVADEIRQGEFSYKRFYLRRFWRLFPALFATLTLTLVGGFLLLSPEHLLGTAESAIASLLWISNLLFNAQSGYFDVESYFKPLLHTWSLSVEEQFYLIWPVTLVAIFSLKRSLAPIAGLVALVMSGLLLSEVWLRIDPSGGFFLLPGRIFEFAIGGILVWVVHRRPSKAMAEILTATGFGLILLSIIGFSPEIPFPGVAALVPCLGAALTIWGGQHAKVGWLLRGGAATWIGRISYSLYLVHWPLIVYYRYWTFRDLTPHESVFLGILSVGLAWLIYRWIEKPLRKGAHLEYDRRFILSIATALVLVVAPPPSLSQTTG